ncbi:MAG: hypothetical protein EP298_04360 [Gammaproteobacteria bacterium]|nr:MAG: hypothetical protein EP298_04360 [Gammaproteobacteria bacterium]UTW41645.1 hypothetical protein KFE69_09010 [bacterium SCSIO 12844]
MNRIPSQFILAIILVGSFFPLSSYAFHCKTEAVINMKNSCPFPLSVAVNNDDSHPKVIDSGATIKVSSFSNGTIYFTDGIVKGNAKIETSAHGNWWDGCSSHIEYTYWGAFDDAQGLDDGIKHAHWHDSSWGVDQKATYTFNLNICKNGYKVNPETIGLGKVFVSKNGLVQDTQQVNFNNQDDRYDFTFTSIGTACHMKYADSHYLLSCDHSNVAGIFLDNHRDLVFVCQQVDNGAAKCPTIISKDDDSDYHYNYGA